MGVVTAAVIGLITQALTNEAHAQNDELFKVNADDPVEDGRFGASVAVSGNLAILGAPGDDLVRPEMAYVFDTTTGDQLFTLSAENDFDKFGSTVAISGDIAIIGASNDDVQSGGFGIQPDAGNVTTCCSPEY